MSEKLEKKLKDAGGLIALRPDDLEALLDRAAEKGASKALHSMGLQDDDAPGDLRDLRQLLDTIRRTKDSALKSVVSFISKLFITALILGALVLAGGDKFLKGD